MMITVNPVTAAMIGMMMINMNLNHSALLNLTVKLKRVPQHPF